MVVPQQAGLLLKDKHQSFKAISHVTHTHCGMVWVEGHVLLILC